MLPFPPFPDKDPTETLDYTADFSAQLTADGGDTIAAVLGVTASPPGLTVSGALESGTTVHCWVAGGDLNVTYNLVFSVRTTAGRIYSRGRLLTVRNR